MKVWLTHERDNVVKYCNGHPTSIRQLFNGLCKFLEDNWVEHGLVKWNLSHGKVYQLSADDSDDICMWRGTLTIVSHERFVGNIEELLNGFMIHTSGVTATKLTYVINIDVFMKYFDQLEQEIILAKLSDQNLTRSVLNNKISP